ncbi:MAG: hypothetical protein K0R47_4575 [Brevibacillus sp.]|nr:hypothetical protein [Brevibacillus sp.]
MTKDLADRVFFVCVVGTGTFYRSGVSQATLEARGRGKRF